MKLIKYVLLLMIWVLPLSSLAKPSPDFSLEKKSSHHKKEKHKNLNLFKKSWSRQLKAGSPKKRYYPEISDPVLSSGVIYLGTQGGEFYAIDKNNGEIKWKYKVGEPVSLSAKVSSKENIYFADTSGRVHALNSQGEEMWHSDLNQEVLNVPQLTSDRLYMLKGEKAWVCLSLATGEVIWTQPLPVFTKRLSIRGQAKLMSDGQSVLAALADGQVYGLDPNTGLVKWAKNFAPPLKTFKDIDANIVSDDKAYYVAGYFGQVHKISKDRQTTFWTLDLGSGVEPLLWQDKIVIADLQGDLSSYNRENAQLEWKTENLGSVLGAPVLFQNWIFVTSHDGSVWIIDPKTGDVVQELKIAGGAISKPLVLEDQVVVLSGLGVLQSFVLK